MLAHVSMHIVLRYYLLFFRSHSFQQFVNFNKQGSFDMRSRFYQKNCLLIKPFYLGGWDENLHVGTW